MLEPGAASQRHRWQDLESSAMTRPPVKVSLAWRKVVIGPRSLDGTRNAFLEQKLTFHGGCRRENQVRLGNHQRVDQERDFGSLGSRMASSRSSSMSLL